MSDDSLTDRLGLFAALAGLSGYKFGRTALMKMCYFLQEVKNVPLNYDFMLYSYGPFDSDVLTDLQTADQLRILKSTVEHYPGGYRYAIEEDNNAPRVKETSQSFLTTHREAIEWAAHTLASRSAGELELASTIVFVSKRRQSTSDTDIVTLVRAIKPHFSISEIQKEIKWLYSNNLLQAET